MSICPFCGVVTDAPHETQAGCIEALNAEIVRMRALLDQVRSATVPGPELPDEGDPEDNQEPV
jgi:capsule polysaccharide export protein KpsE/RkpR